MELRTSRLVSALVVIAALVIAGSARADTDATVDSWADSFMPDALVSYHGAVVTGLIVVGAGNPRSAPAAAGLRAAYAASGIADLVMDGGALGDVADLGDAQIVNRARNLPISHVAIVRAFGGEAGQATAVVAVYDKWGAAYASFKVREGDHLPFARAGSTPRLDILPKAVRLRRAPRLVQAVVAELDGSARGFALMHNLKAAGNVGGLVRWALELQAIPSERNGNYLFRFYWVLRDQDARLAQTLVETLGRAGVAVGPDSGGFDHLDHLDHNAPLPKRPDPTVARAPMSRWVDSFVTAHYDLGYLPPRRGRLSYFLQLTYKDGARLDIDIRRISDNYDPAPYHALAHAYVGPAGRVIPLRLGRSTTPRLWKAKHDVALAAMHKYNRDFEDLVAIGVTGVMTTLPLGLIAPVEPPPVPATPRVMSRPSRVVPSTGTRVEPPRAQPKPAQHLPAATGLIRPANGRAVFKGLEVRGMRDLSHVPESTLRAQAKLGFASKDARGRALVLHHHRQNPAGPIVEMPAANHSIGNPRQHPLGSATGSGLTPAQRAQFNAWRVQYWKARAQGELARRGLQ